MLLRRTLRCSFCNRQDSEVAKLVAGPPRPLAGCAYICDRCAAESVRIMEAHTGDPALRTPSPGVARRIVDRLRWWGAPQRRDATAPQMP